MKFSYSITLTFPYVYMYMDKCVHAYVCVWMFRFILFFLCCFSPFAFSYHFAVCSSLSIAINHFDTHTTDTHSQKIQYVWFVFFSLLCSSLLFSAFLSIGYTHAHINSYDAHHYMHTHTHTKQRTCKIPRNNRFVWLPLSFFFFLFFFFALVYSLTLYGSDMQNYFCVWALRDAMTD